MLRQSRPMSCQASGTAGSGSPIPPAIIRSLYRACAVVAKKFDANPAIRPTAIQLYDMHRTHFPYLQDDRPLRRNSVSAGYAMPLLRSLFRREPGPTADASQTLRDGFLFLQRLEVEVAAAVVLREWGQVLNADNPAVSLLGGMMTISEAYRRAEALRFGHAVTGRKSHLPNPPLQRGKSRHTDQIIETDMASMEPIRELSHVIHRRVMESVGPEVNEGMPLYGASAWEHRLAIMAAIVKAIREEFTLIDSTSAPEGLILDHAVRTKRLAWALELPLICYVAQLFTLRVQVAVPSKSRPLLVVRPSEIWTLGLGAVEEAERKAGLDNDPGEPFELFDVSSSSFVSYVDAVKSARAGRAIPEWQVLEDRLAMPTSLYLSTMLSFLDDAVDVWRRVSAGKPPPYGMPLEQEAPEGGDSAALQQLFPGFSAESNPSPAGGPRWAMPPQPPTTPPYEVPFVDGELAKYLSALLYVSRMALIQEPDRDGVVEFNARMKPVLKRMLGEGETETEERPSAAGGGEISAEVPQAAPSENVGEATNEKGKRVMVFDLNNADSPGGQMRLEMEVLGQDGPVRHPRGRSRPPFGVSKAQHNAALRQKYGLTTTGEDDDLVTACFEALGAGLQEALGRMEEERQSSGGEQPETLVMPPTAKKGRRGRLSHVRLGASVDTQESPARSVDRRIGSTDGRLAPLQPIVELSYITPRLGKPDLEWRPPPEVSFQPDQDRVDQQVSAFADEVRELAADEEDKAKVVRGRRRYNPFR